MDQADVVLLERWVGRRDAEAFQAIVARHSAMVFSACRRVLGDAAGAEDVTQECFLKLAMGDARPGPFLGPWLHKVATRRCLDTLRSEHRRRAREARYVAEGPQSVEVRWETLEPLIDEALANLPERYRVPIAVHFLEGLSQDEVAQRLGMPRRTVSYRISQGLERLGAYLRSRGVNVASGVLAARLADIPTETLPAELAAKLSKMALAGAAHVLPHKLWITSALTSHKVAALVAVACLLGAAYLGRIYVNAPEPAMSVQATKPAAEVPKKTESIGKPPSESGAVMTATTTASPVEPQESPAPSVEAPLGEEAEPCTLTGSVVDRDGEPIANALVQEFLADFPSSVDASTKVFSARTDKKGLFRLSGVPYVAGYPFSQLNVTAEGFRSYQCVVILDQAGDTREVRVELVEGVTLPGKVIGPDGAPVPEARILVHVAYPFGPMNAIVETDGNGLFQLGFGEEGTAVLRAITHEWGDAFFDIDVRRGSVIELCMPGAAQLTGTVVGADGAPITKAYIEVLLTRGTPGQASSTNWKYKCPIDSNGRYAFSVLPPDAEYSAKVIDAKEKALSIERPLGVLAPGSSTQCDFRLGAPARIRGSITGEQTGRPQKGASVGWLSAEDFKAERFSHNEDTVSIREDGTYEMELFSAGAYRIYPIPAAGEWGEDFAQKYGHTVDVILGTEQALELRLPDGFSLAARVVDDQGKPLPNVMIQPGFNYEPDRNVTLGPGTTDALGCFRFEGFPPGKAAWLVVHGNREAETSHIVGEPGVDYPEETVVMYGSSSLSGVALGPDGKPLADCRIAVHMDAVGIEVDGARVGAVSQVIYVESDANGAFTLPQDVPATSLELQIHATGGDGQSYTAPGCRVECVTGQVADLGALTFAADAAVPEIRVGAAMVTESE